MNRNEEYLHILAELEAEVPSMEPALTKARKRRARKRMICRPLASLAAVFAAFVLLVNFSAPVANACSQIPILRELAEAVTFSRSLSAAVENEYAQVIDQKQTVNGITAEVEYVIVDQKQIYIFFRLDSMWHRNLRTDAWVEWDEPLTKATRWCDWFAFTELDNGLRLLSLNLLYDQIAPSKLNLTLKVYEEPRQEVDYFWEWEDPEREYLADLEFTLEFDPKFVAPIKTYELNVPLEIEGQQLAVTSIEVLPTCMYVNLEENKSNTMWLDHLAVHVEDADGTRYRWESGTPTRSGGLGTMSPLQMYLESPYFYETDGMKLVISSASWLSKENGKVYVDLATGMAEGLPEGYEMISAEKSGEDWLITVHSDYTEGTTRDIRLDFHYYDPEGKERGMQMNGAYGEPNEDGEVTYIVYTIRLRDYTYDEVWLTTVRMRGWTAENPIVIPVE